MAKKQFKPFEHEDLQLKNYLIDYARTLASKGDLEAQLACAVIYASFAEYMAGHLLDNLRHLMYTTTYREFAAILFVDQRKDSKVRTMNQVVSLLQGYEFPDKKEVIDLLQSINKSRNNLFHNFASTSGDQFNVFDDDIDNIKTKTEELFTKIGIIYAGLVKILLPNSGGENINVNENKVN